LSPSTLSASSSDGADALISAADASAVASGVVGAMAHPIEESDGAAAVKRPSTESALAAVIFSRIDPMNVISVEQIPILAANCALRIFMKVKSSFRTDKADANAAAS
jgi:hypothetical protein